MNSKDKIIVKALYAGLENTTELHNVASEQRADGRILTILDDEIKLIREALGLFKYEGAGNKMKKYKPDEMMPDKFTDVLGYFGEDYGHYTVIKYSGSQWLDAWSDDVIAYRPDYWIDLADIEGNLK